MDPRDLFRGFFGFPHRGGHGAFEEKENFSNYNEDERDGLTQDDWFSDRPRDDFVPPGRGSDSGRDEWFSDRPRDDFVPSGRGSDSDRDEWFSDRPRDGFVPPGRGSDSDRGGGGGCYTGRGPDSFSFSVFTDPLEIHKFFDQQMDEMMKSFARGFGLGDSGEFFPPSQFGDRRAIGPGQNPLGKKDEGTHGRDFMLKYDDIKEKKDSDLDDRDVTADDLTSLLKKGPGDQLPSPGIPDGPGADRFGNERFPASPWSRDGGGPSSSSIWSGVFSSLWSDRGNGGQSAPGSFGFSQSQSNSIVQRSDGSSKSEQRIRNSDGSETVIITRRIGDQEHETRTTIENGVEKQTETFRNMSESDLSDFNDRWAGGGQLTPARPKKSPDLLRSPREDTVPPRDRLYSSIFSKYFGDN